MTTVTSQVLFSKNNKRFLEISDIAKTVSTVYGGYLIVRDGIFTILHNYARKKDIPIQILRYPFHDDDLWAFTFLKGGTIFICINSELPLCK